LLLLLTDWLWCCSTAWCSWSSVDLTLFTRCMRAGITNDCSTGNGGCEQICLLGRDKAVVCKCSAGYKPTDDQRACASTFCDRRKWWCINMRSIAGGKASFCGGYNYGSTSIRRPFDGHSTSYHRSLRSQLGNPLAAVRLTCLFI